MCENKDEIVSGGLMTVSEVARFLGLSRASIYLLMERGELPWVKLGRARRVPRRAVVELASRNLLGGWRIDSGRYEDAAPPIAPPSRESHDRGGIFDEPAHA